MCSVTIMDSRRPTTVVDEDMDGWFIVGAEGNNLKRNNVSTRNCIATEIKDVIALVNDKIKQSSDDNEGDDINDDVKNCKNAAQQVEFRTTINEGTPEEAKVNIWMTEEMRNECVDLIDFYKALYAYKDTFTQPSSTVNESSDLSASILLPESWLFQNHRKNLPLTGFDRMTIGGKTVIIREDYS